MPSKSSNACDSDLIAAVDLGSNSFHLTLAKIQHNNLQVMGRVKEKVRLVSGLDENNCLDEASQQRAFACLAQFHQRIMDLPAHRVKAVGTFALRKAKNARAFLLQAQKILGFPIEIISGREEARLIFEAVAHFQQSEEKKLVVDIGGGSTEFAIGEGFTPLLLDSLQMGCVSFSNRYFSGGELSKDHFRNATTAARLELLSIQDLYLRESWQEAIGTSGTVESILGVLQAQKPGIDCITLSDLIGLKKQLIALQSIDKIQLPGLADNRVEILPAGLAILIAVFKSLKISSLKTCPAALREGLIYEVAGFEKPFDIKDRAIKGLLTRYHIDFDQARRVNQSAMQIWQTVHMGWNLEDDYFRQLLSWAARCHEIGLSINFGKQQKHGEYILTHCDISGFSVPQQQILALLVRSFRRKFPLHRFDWIESPLFKEQLIRLARILRLAVMINHRRRDFSYPPMTIEIVDQEMILTFPNDYLMEHSLLKADLELERDFLSAEGLTLTICEAQK